jgi:hypothetical protein
MVLPLWYCASAVDKKLDPLLCIARRSEFTCLGIDLDLLDPGGISQSPSHSGCSASATCMKSDQIGSAEFAPVKPSCEPSSKPTHTAQTRFGV